MSSETQTDNTNDSPPKEDTLPRMESSSELCSICCDPIQVVAVGRCGHTLTCAICTLRLRLCYRDNSCPFCKTQLKRVFLIEKPSDGSSISFEYMDKHRWKFEKNNAWASGIWVHKESQCDGRNLMESLMAKMKMSCRLCDPSGLRDEFDSFKELREHLKRAHDGSTVCNVCYQANRYFPRELEIFESDVAFQTHVDGHPRCEYCGHRYFGKDELFNHMRKKHCLCQLCHARGERHVYFENTQHYLRHLREAHFACYEPECANALIAFNTPQELSGHLQELHGIVATGSGRRRQLIRDSHPRGNMLATHLPAPVYHPSPQQRGFEGNDLQLRGESGMVMIDDDLPPTYALPLVARPQQQLPTPNRGRPVQEEFPALPTTNPAALPPGPPKRVLVRTQCPCGRLSRSVLVTEGTVPDALTCDAECERAQHRARLAEAFNIDTETYSGAFTANFSIDLITWARSQPQRAQKIEEQLHDRIRLRDVQRFKVDGVTRDMKKLVIELVDSCGAVGRSVHNSNSVEVVLTDRVCLPAKKLTQYATSLSEEEYRSLVRESLKHVLFLEDIQPSANLRMRLRGWDGDYEMEFLSSSVAKLKFRTPQAFKSASDGLGGGIRGAFRVRYPLKESGTSNDESESSKQPSISDAIQNLPSEGQRSRRSKWNGEEQKSTPSEILELGNSFDVLSRL